LTQKKRRSVVADIHPDGAAQKRLKLLDAVKPQERASQVRYGIRIGRTQYERAG
jgi:hypothetical protein